MSKRITKNKISRAARTVKKPKRHPGHSVTTPEASSQTASAVKEPAAMKTAPTTVVPMEASTPEIPRQPAGESPKTMSSEPLPSSQREEVTHEVAYAPGGGTDEEEGILELLAFQLADEEYALDILMIKEIIRSLEITHVPRRPPVIKGIISLRGTIIPIYDLRTRLGLSEPPPTRHTRILVVGLNKGLIGIIADRVTEVVKVRAKDVEPPPATGDGMTTGHLKGVTRFNGRLIILLDLTKAVTL